MKEENKKKLDEMAMKLVNFEPGTRNLTKDHMKNRAISCAEYIMNQILGQHGIYKEEKERIADHIFLVMTMDTELEET